MGGISPHGKGSRHPDGPPVPHSRQVFGAHEKTMLDGMASGLNGDLYRQSAIGMHHHLKLHAPGFANGQRKFLQGKLGQGFLSKAEQAVDSRIDHFDVIGADESRQAGFTANGLRQRFAWRRRSADQLSVSTALVPGFSGDLDMNALQSDLIRSKGSGLFCPSFILRTSPVGTAEPVPCRLRRL